MEEQAPKMPSKRKNTRANWSIPELVLADIRACRQELAAVRRKLDTLLKEPPKVENEAMGRSDVCRALGLSTNATTTLRNRINSLMVPQPVHLYGSNLATWWRADIDTVVWMMRNGKSRADIQQVVMAMNARNLRDAEAASAENDAESADAPEAAATEVG
jgi:predicted DNA-binding transcriptional regulator AlpA